MNIVIYDIPIIYDCWKDISLFYLIDAEYRWLNSAEVAGNDIYYNWTNEVNYNDTFLTKHIYNETVRFFKAKEIEEVDEFVVTMPRDVWEKVKEKTSRLSQGIRKSTLRVFVYIYYWAMRFQGSYSRPRELMKTELKMNKDTLARSLDYLNQCGLIVRTDYSMRENDRYARRYYIPEELWNYQCRKEVEKFQKCLVN